MKYFAVFFLLIISFESFAQSVVFNKVIATELGCQGFYLLNHPSKQIVLFGKENISDTTKLKGFIYKLNYDGDSLSNCNFFLSGSNYILDKKYTNYLVLNDTVVISGLYIDKFWVKSRFFSFALDFEGRAKNQCFSDTMYFVSFRYIINKNGDFLFFEGVGPTSALSKFKITRFSNNFKISNIVYLDSFFIDISKSETVNETSFTQLIDDSYLVTISKKVSNSPYNLYQAYHYHLDSNFRFIQYFGDTSQPSRFIMKKFLSGIDSSVAVVYSIAPTGIQQDTISKRIMIEKRGLDNKLYWSHDFGINSNTIYIEIINTIDSGFALLCQNIADDDKQINLIKINKHGEEEWVYTINDTASLLPVQIIQTLDSDYVVLFTATEQGSILLKKIHPNPVGVLDKNISQNLYISPNPVKDYIEISSSKRLITPTHKELDGIRIYDILGECVKKVIPSLISATLNERQGTGLRIDVSDLAAGIYMVRCGDEFGKFIKE